jgi:endonuclease V-like protein UPF0215 family
MKTTIQRNGWDATSQLAKMIKSSPHFQQVRLLMTDGLAFGGLNIVNIKTLHEKTGIPIIAVSTEKEASEILSGAIKGLDKYGWRRSALKAAAQPVPMTPGRRPVYVHYTGIESGDVKSIMRVVCTTEVPEPIRVARVFASAFNQFQKD